MGRREFRRARTEFARRAPTPRVVRKSEIHIVPSTSLRLSGYPAKCTSMLNAERFAHKISSPKRCRCKSNPNSEPLRCKWATTAFHIDSPSSSIFRWTSLARPSSLSSPMCGMTRVGCFLLSLCGKDPWRPQSRYYG